MTEKQVMLTEEGLKKLEEKLEHLKTVRRTEVSERIKQAISFGDISENSEYEDAKNEQAFIEGEIMTIENMLRNRKPTFNQPAQVKGSGDIIWPLGSRRVTSLYGWRVHPIFGTSRYHSGIDIAANYGEPIWAAAGGTVIHSGWLGGYGKTIIIDHGGGLTTLYAHNSKLSLGVGATVKRGQTIALAGSTGYSTGPHLHFEVRKFGEPVNPYNYF